MADKHGQSPASWAAVIVVLVAFVVGGVALVFTPINWVLFWIGVGLVPVGLVLGKVMSAMGLGVDSPHERHQV